MRKLSNHYADTEKILAIQKTIDSFAESARLAFDETQIYLTDLEKEKFLRLQEKKGLINPLLRKTFDTRYEARKAGAHLNR